MPKHPLTTLIILDGWGLNPNSDHNAVALADTPTMDRISTEYATTTLITSGRHVGLPKGLMGNSEVGHLNLGAGRVVTQAMAYIEERIDDGSFLTNDALMTAVNRAKHGRKLHLIGLISDGGVHSWPTHYQSLLEITKQQGLDPNRVFIHAFLDGRDTPPKSGIDRLKELEDFTSRLGYGRIASLCGRYYAMDRDQRWERTQTAYDMLTAGKAAYHANSPQHALEQAYERGETDEFVQATLINNTPILTRWHSFIH